MSWLSDPARRREAERAAHIQYSAFSFGELAQAL
jgi:hypothetical protein